MGDLTRSHRRGEAHQHAEQRSLPMGGVAGVEVLVGGGVVRDSCESPVVGKSLENQMQLLDGQSKAMVGLINLYSFQA
uniref:Uncharacterized protein n=1 Tax=Oryza glaberrima TaxID=4538 RepID=I1P011_ORYGL